MREILRHWARLLSAIAVMPLLVLIQPTTETHAASGSLRVDPVSQTVAGGTSFKVKVVQTADTATSGAQTDIQFDPAVVQVTNIESGSAYSDATLLAGHAPQTIADVIAEANSTGTLLNLATFYIPGSGSAPPGESEFLVITMQGKANGSSTLALKNVLMVDDTGAAVPATGTDGSVTISGDAPAGSIATAAPTSTATASADSTPSAGVTSQPQVSSPVSTVLSSSQRSSNLAGSGLLIAPSEAAVGKGESFQLEIKQKATKPLSSVTLKLSFNKKVLQLESIQPGSTWSSALGTSQQNLESALVKANEEGVLETSFISSSPVAAGEATLLTLGLKSSTKDASTLLQFDSMQLQDADGNLLEGAWEDGKVVVGAGGGGPGFGIPVMLMALLGLAATTTVGGTYYMAQRRRRHWA